jgi:membrane-bound lytic murein transglycosylase D
LKAKVYMPSTPIRRPGIALERLRGCCLALLLAACAPWAAAQQPAGSPGATTPAAAAAARPLTGSPAIPRPPELQRDVDFWIRIYSEITTNEGVLHDEWDLSIIYARLQFASDSEPRERRDAVDATRDRYVATLTRLAAVLAARAGGPASDPTLTPDEQRVLSLWGDRATPAQLTEATRGIRFQLGQADRFREGIVRSGAWEPHIAETLANLGLPPELAALPHVESSFTPEAYSKVGAAGLWQFMRSTGRRYMRIDDAVDERLDPFRSTEAAAQLLSYNYRVLGTWPLALTAYNHGAAGMRRARDAMGTDDFVTIARRFRGPTFGFASRNFYPSFLAALTIDQNPEKYFPGVERAPEQRFTEVEMPGYAPLAAVERAVGVRRAEIRALNTALRPPVFEGKRFVPRGYKLRLPPASSGMTSELLASRIGASDLYAGQIVERSHRVRKGQTLASIAKSYGASATSLAGLNGLDASRRVRPGMQLRLPDKRPPLLAETRPAAAAAAADAGVVAALGPAATGPDRASSASSASSALPAPPAAAGAGPAATAAAGPDAIYIVRGGDTLFAIAARFGLTPAELMRTNRIRDPDFVFEGQRLMVGRPVAAAAAREAAEPDAAEAAAPAAGADSAGAAAVAAAAGPTTRRVGRANAVAAVPRSAEPVSAAQAESQGPSVGPGTGVPAVADATDLSVAADGTIRVIAEETLGHYADWLDLSAARLRELNQLKYGQAVLLGRKLRLDFARVGRSAFELKRREFHGALQSRFFEQRRILGTEVYIVRRGDSLWSIAQRYSGVPVWLLQQYNPDLDLTELRAGAQLVVPKLESTAAGA